MTSRTPIGSGTTPVTSTTPIGSGTGIGTGIGAGTGTGSEGAGVVYTGSDPALGYSSVSGSGSSSGSGEAMLADGSYLAGLAMGDSPRSRTVSSTFLYSVSFLLILLSFL